MMDNSSPKVTVSRNRLPWVLIVIFILLLAALFYARYYADSQNRASLRASTYDRLNSIAGLKRDQISAWLAEHESTARLLGNTSFISSEIWAYIMDPGSTGIRHSLDDWLATIQDTYGYREVILLGASGATLAALPQVDITIPDAMRPLAEKAIAGQAVISSDLYLDENGSPSLDYLAPVLLQTSSGPRTIAVLILRLDPAASLYPLVNSWPSPTSTSETLLIRQEGQEVILLNQSTLGRDAPLTRRFQVSDQDLAVSQAALMKNGTSAGTDTRGTYVFTSFRQVPNSSWIVVVKVDQKEIFAPLQEQDNLMSLLTIALFLAAMLAAVLITRQRESQYYKQMYLAEVNRQALSEHLLYLSRYANDIILLTDENWTILEANDRAISAYGFPLEKLRELNFYGLSDPDTRTDLVRQIQPLNAQGGLVFEAVHQRMDGTTFPVECSTRIIDVGGRKFYQSIIRDITERKSAEEELLQSERRFRLFYEQAPICYQALDQDGNFTDVNEAWQETFGFHRSDVIGRPFADMLTNETIGRWLVALPEFEKTGELHGCEVEVNCADGARLIVSITGKISYTDYHKIQVLHCVLNDVTEQRLSAAQVQHMNEELEKRVLERTAQLEAANKELEAFSYSVSHDLRAPLRAIDGFSRIVIDEFGEDLAQEAQRYLNLVRDNAHTMSCLIDNLLTFSRLSRQPLNRQRVDLNELVRESLQTLATGQECRKITYLINPLPACEGDPILLKQVMINLLSNAIKFSSKKPEALIEVGCLEEAREHIYYVKDNGVGFDMQYAPKLFGVFQRLHKVEDYEGTGVGLAIVQRIIHRHGGRVWAMGEINQGATFCFTLEETDHHE